METPSLLISLIVSIPFLLQAQPTNVQISTPGDWPSEPSVCVNPANTDQILVGAVRDNSYSSTDGGYTWTHMVLNSPYGVNGDPVVLAGNNGSFYYFHLVFDLSRVVCQRMEVFGWPWASSTFTATHSDFDIDKEWAAFDPVYGNLYTCWTRFNTWGSTSPDDSSFIFLSKSTDDGVTWGPQKLISNIGGNATGGFGSVHGSYITTGPGGEVYVAWWSPAGLMFDRSLDAGENWLNNDINVTGFPVQWIVTLPGIMTGVSFPVISCDRSGGPYHGTIYINWTDRRGTPGDANIWLVKSTDGGTTWSAPVRVNDDETSKHQFFNYMTIDQVTGKIYIVFYDRRNYANSNTDVYLAISSDGGETFNNYKISETPFIPFSTVFFGHYIGVSAHNNKVFASWMRMDNGDLSLWGAPVDPATVGTEKAPVIPVSLSQNSPNPFHEDTFFSFKLEHASNVHLMITDIVGTTVAVPIDGETLTAGKHVVRFNPERWNLAPGMYHYTLITDNKVVTKKMLFYR
jgi:hypothetical protein